MPHDEIHDDKLFEELDRAFDDIQSGKLEVPAFGTEGAAPVGLPAAEPGLVPSFGDAAQDTAGGDDSESQILQELKLIRLNLDALPDVLRDVFNL